jgi:DHA2 family multidrug resistance protein
MSSVAASPVAVPGLRRNMVTICAMTATIMQALDTTIANVALPYMQGSLSASQDQINWVLTSYIVAAAIMTAPVGWIANRFGRKRIFIVCSAGFTFASVLCGLAQDINQMVLFRLLQGVFGAALVPLSQAVMLDSYSLQERAKAMSIWGMGVMMGPIMGPSLGAWLTETYSWHWVFFVNLPFGIFTVLGLLAFMDETKKNSDLRFDWFGFAALAIGIGAMQVALDRGEQLGWLESNEIIAEMLVSIAGFYYFFAHSFTTAKPFIQFAIFKDKNFVGGCVFMAVMGLVLFSTMALSSPYLQNVIGYPIITAGLLLATRGCGTFVAMMLVGRVMKYIEARTLIIAGLTLMAGSLFFMTGWTDQTGVPEIVVLSIIQGFGLGLVFVPLSHGGIPDAAQSFAHRRHLDADLDAQCRQLDRHFGRDRATNGRVAADLRHPVAAYQSVQPCAADAGCAQHDRSRHRRRPRHGRRHGRHAIADHRVLAGLPAGDDRHAVRDPARGHDRLDQGRAAQAGAGNGPCRGDGLGCGSPCPGRDAARSAASQNWDRREHPAPLRAPARQRTASQALRAALRPGHGPSHVEEHCFVVTLEADVEAIDRAAVALLARRDQRAAAIRRHQRQHRIG